MRFLHFVVVVIFCCAAVAQADQDSKTKRSGDQSGKTKVEKSTDTPDIITRPLTPNTGEQMKTPCWKTERYCTEWLPDGKCKLWDSRQVQVSC